MSLLCIMAENSPGIVKSHEKGVYIKAGSEEWRCHFWPGSLNLSQCI